MCCRFRIEPEEETERLLEIINRKPLPGRKIKMEGEIFPGDTVPVVAMTRNLEKSAFAMEWGFLLENRKRVFNTRSETALEKPLFRDSMRSHRCAVPASYYLEWDAEKTKYAIRSKDKILWFAGLYRLEKTKPVFSILTRAPSTALLAIHPRMPVILPPDAVDAWISPHEAPERILEMAVTDLIAENWEGSAG